LGSKRHISSFDSPPTPGDKEFEMDSLVRIILNAFENRRKMENSALLPPFFMFEQFYAHWVSLLSFSLLFIPV